MVSKDGSAPSQTFLTRKCFLFAGAQSKELLAKSASFPPVADFEQTYISAISTIRYRHKNHPGSPAAGSGHVPPPITLGQLDLPGASLNPRTPPPLGQHTHTHTHFGTHYAAGYWRIRCVIATATSLEGSRSVASHGCGRRVLDGPLACTRTVAGAVGLWWVGGRAGGGGGGGGTGVCPFQANFSVVAEEWGDVLKCRLSGGDGSEVVSTVGEMHQKFDTVRRRPQSRAQIYADTAATGAVFAVTYLAAQSLGFQAFHSNCLNVCCCSLFVAVRAATTPGL